MRRYGSLISINRPATKKDKKKKKMSNGWMKFIAIYPPNDGWVKKQDFASITLKDLKGIYTAKSFVTTLRLNRTLRAIFRYIRDFKTHLFWSTWNGCLFIVYSWSAIKLILKYEKVPY